MIKRFFLHYALVILVVTLILFFNGDAIAHVPEGTGDTLQLYSSWTNTPPRINGCVTDRTNPVGFVSQGTDNDEWDDAYVRVVPLSDGSTATIFLMNDATNLYIAVVYTLAGDNGNPNRVTLYFDHGVGGGEHDDALTVDNENMVSSNRRGAACVPYDRYWAVSYTHLTLPTN